LFSRDKNYNSLYYDIHSFIPLPFVCEDHRAASDTKAAAGDVGEVYKSWTAKSLIDLLLAPKVRKADALMKSGAARREK
jgi:hypothetical protein